MGYWSSNSAAGKNKKHESTAIASRIDSFTARTKAEALTKQNINFFDISNIGIVNDDKINFEWVSCNYGTSSSMKRLYFICSKCRRKVRFLYVQKNNKWLMCRKCSKLNYPIQQVAKGEARYEEQIRSILKKFNYKTDLSPYKLAEFYLQRPRYMHKSTFNKYIEKLTKIQQLWFENYYGELKKIAKI